MKARAAPARAQKPPRPAARPGSRKDGQAPHTAGRGRASRYYARMLDAVTARAVEDYHKLLRDERELREELEELFFERMRHARLTFGGRVLCPFLRPNFVSPALYEQVRSVCRLIFGAMEKVEERLGRDALGPRGPAPGGARAGGHRPRLPTQLAHLAPRLLRHPHLVPVRGAERGEPGRHRLQRGAGRHLPGAAADAEVPGASSRCAASTPGSGCCRRCSSATARRAAAPNTPPSPSWTTKTCPPAPSTTSSATSSRRAATRPSCAIRATSRSRTGALRYEGRAIDIVYKRLLVNELIERQRRAGRAAGGGAPARGHHREPVPLQAHPQEGHLRRAHRRRRCRPSSRPRSGRPSPPTCPGRAGWPRARRPAAAQTIDLPAYILGNRERLVMKPNDEYGGKGVFIGWEMSDAEWAAALAEALRSSYVVQEKVETRPPELPRAGARPAVPRLHRGPEPLRLPGRGGGLPDPPLRHLPGQRELGRRTGALLPGRRPAERRRP